MTTTATIPSVYLPTPYILPWSYRTCISQSTHLSTAERIAGQSRIRCSELRRKSSMVTSSMKSRDGMNHCHTLRRSEPCKHQRRSMEKCHKGISPAVDFGECCTGSYQPSRRLGSPISGHVCGVLCPPYLPRSHWAVSPPGGASNRAALIVIGKAAVIDAGYIPSTVHLLHSKFRDPR